MKAIALLLSAAAFLFAAAPANAHRIHAKPIKKLTTTELRQELQHARGAVRFFNYSPKGRYAVAINLFETKCWRLKQVGRRRTCYVSRGSLREHAWLMRVTQERLVPPLPWAFWNCVSSGWSGGKKGVGYNVRKPNGERSNGEGGLTSYNPAGPYFGRYQADWVFIRTWAPDLLRKYGGRDPRSWSLVDQTVMAERGFAGWRGMRGQGWHAWPETTWGCLFLR